MSSRRLSSVNKDELVSTPIRDFCLWPMAPSGTLLEPSHKYKVSEDSKQNMLDFERSMEHVEKFFQTKATIMQWYIATIIGILGNIFVAIIFTESIQLYNARITVIILLLLIIITRIGIEYMPSYSLRYTIIGDYKEFPKGYERRRILRTVQSAI
ncbi:unnamed protein product [marine sediment metagenome]|uniref:Uncharacterized protein n=1 Tax=marine sediment metagenome TaxID=412755 RepID=X1VS56_9ZZZZ